MGRNGVEGIEEPKTVPIRARIKIPKDAVGNLKGIRNPIQKQDNYVLFASIDLHHIEKSINEELKVSDNYILNLLFTEFL